MHARVTVPPALARLARCQAGVVTREEVVGSGLATHVLGRLSRSGEWQRLGQGVFLTTPGPVPWEASAWAGVLLGGDQARLGPASSGHLHGLVTPAPDPVDVLVPFEKGVRVRGPWTFSRERRGTRSARTTGSPPRLLATDTVLDLGSACGEGELVDLVIRATAQRVVTAASLATALAHRSRHPHPRLLETLLTDVAEGTESQLELSYLREVERAHGLPEGKRQRCRGGLRHRTDVGYDDYGLLVELDGRLGHDGAGRFRDMRRDNEFTLRALLTLRYGWFDVVDRPCEVAFQVWTVAAGRGWTEAFGRCSRCERVAGFN